MPHNYASFYESVSQLQHAVMSDIAKAMQQRLNNHVRELPQYSLEDKRNLSSTINQDLRGLHLCLKCPTTGLPATLIGSYRDDEERSSRFRFNVQEQGRTVQKGVFHKLPDLEVIGSTSTNRTTRSQ